jgi:hypothetical protein
VTSNESGARPDAPYSLLVTRYSLLIASLMTFLSVAALGAFHGLNPAMGWLFAAALGLQERSAGAVVRALPPIVLGHAASVAVVVAAAAGAEWLVPGGALRWAGAALPLGCAVLLLRRRAHPRRVGMRLGAGGLFAWSFAMASAHGAGLMLLPVLLALGHGADPGHVHHGIAADGTLVLAVHTAAMLLAMTCAALLAFRLAGVGVLRRIWIDTDVVWSGVLAASGVAVLVVT